MRRSNGTGSATGGETTGVRARAPVAVARPRRWRVVLATLVSGLAVGGVAWATEKEAGAGARASGGGAEPASAPADRAQAPAWLPIGDEPPPSPAPDEDPADAPPLPPDDVPPDDESEPEGPGADSLLT